MLTREALTFCRRWQNEHGDKRNQKPKRKRKPVAALELQAKAARKNTPPNSFRCSAGLLAVKGKRFGNRPLRVPLTAARRPRSSVRKFFWGCFPCWLFAFPFSFFRAPRVSVRSSLGSRSARCLSRRFCSRLVRSCRLLCSSLGASRCGLPFVLWLCLLLRSARCPALSSLVGSARPSACRLVAPFGLVASAPLAVPRPSPFGSGLAVPPRGLRLLGVVFRPPFLPPRAASAAVGFSPRVLPRFRACLVAFSPFGFSPSVLSRRLSPTLPT